MNDIIEKFDSIEIIENDYIAFALGSDLLKDKMPYETDLAYITCRIIQEDFLNSEYNVDTKGLYDCLEDYISEKKDYIDEVCNFAKEQSFMEYLYKVQ